MPRSRSEIEISLDIMPTIETGIAYGVTLRPSLDEEVVVLPLADVDAAAAAADDHAGARLAGAEAGVVPRFARGDDADQRRARIALRIGAMLGDPDRRRRRSPARSSIVTPVTGAATRQAKSRRRTR